MSFKWTLMPPSAEGPDSRGRFHVPSGNCSRSIFGRTARIRPRRSSFPTSEIPPPIEISSAESSGVPPPAFGSLPMTTSCSRTDGGKIRKSTVRKDTGRWSASDRRACETPWNRFWKRSDVLIAQAERATNATTIA